MDWMSYMSELAVAKQNEIRERRVKEREVRG